MRIYVHPHPNLSVVLLQILQILQIGVIFTPKASTFPHVPKYLKYQSGSKRKEEDTYNCMNKYTKWAEKYKDHLHN